MQKISNFFFLFLSFFSCLLANSALQHETIDRDGGEKKLFERITQEKDDFEKSLLIREYMGKHDTENSLRVIDELLTSKDSRESLFKRFFAGTGESLAFNVDSVSHEFTQNNRTLLSTRLMEISSEPLHYQTTHFNCPSNVRLLKNNDKIVLPFQFSSEQITALQQIQPKMSLQPIFLLFLVRHLEFRILRAFSEKEINYYSYLSKEIEKLLQEHQKIAEQEKLAYQEIIKQLKDHHNSIDENKYETNQWGNSSVKTVFLDMILNLQQVAREIFFQKKYEWF